MSNNSEKSIEDEFKEALILHDKKKIYELLKDENNELDLKKVKRFEYEQSVLTYALCRDFEEDIIIEILSHSSIYNNIEYINKVDKWGNTAIHRAAQRGYIQVIRQILSMSSDCWKIKNHDGKTPAIIAVTGFSPKGSSIAVLLDSSTTDSSVIKQEINPMNLRPFFFAHFFKNIGKINPSSETLNWFMSHPKIDFSNFYSLVTYLCYVSSPIDFDFIKKFTIDDLGIREFPLNPCSCLSTFQSLIVFDQETKKTNWSPTSKNGRKNLLESLKFAIRSSSTHSCEIIKWILIQLDGKIKENEIAYVYLMIYFLIHETGIVESLLYPVIPIVPSLKEIASNFVLKKGIKYDSTTLVIDIIELLEDPRNWVKEDDKYHLTFLYEGWRRVQDEIDARLSLLIEGLGGVEVIKKRIMNEDGLEMIFDAFNYMLDSLQLPITLSLLIHKYKIIDIEEVKELIGEEKVKEYLKKCETESPYFIDIKTIFGI